MDEATRIDSPALDGDVSHATRIDEPPVTLVAPPTDAARYESLDALGRGGMGEVGLARDRRIGRTVAVKRALGGAADNARFMREICVQGQLEHPAIVPLYDVETDAQGCVSFTMKHIRGRTLRAILNSLITTDRTVVDVFTRRRLLNSFVTVCQAVAFAHSRGVIHRDLKPENLMLGEFGEVYVLDWGVARIRSAGEDITTGRLSGPADDGSTREGSVIGTPGYMAPEQCEGMIEELDERADIYSLGAILFEGLTLLRLHASDRIASTLAGADARASIRAPHRDVPPELEALCIKATATDRNERYASVKELITIVEGYLNDDRDLELRRSIAARHAEVATAAAAKLGTDADSTELRRTALAEAGRAIALDAANEPAQHAMFRLLTEAPREVPPEAQAELTAAIEQRRRQGALLGATSPIVLVACIPFMLKMGLRDVRPFIAFYAVVFLFMLGCLATRRAKHPSNEMVVGLAALNLVPYLALGFAFGPLFVVPSFCMMNTTLFQLYLEKYRAHVIVLAAVPMLLPLLFGAPYEFGVAGMLVPTRMLDLVNAPWTIALIVALNLIAIIISGVVVARDRITLLAAERQLILNAWQLRQVLPKG